MPATIVSVEDLLGKLSNSELYEMNSMIERRRTAFQVLFPMTTCVSNIQTGEPVSSGHTKLKPMGVGQLGLDGNFYVWEANLAIKKARLADAQEATYLQNQYSTQALMPQYPTGRSNSSQHMGPQMTTTQMTSAQNTTSFCAAGPSHGRDAICAGQGTNLARSIQSMTYDIDNTDTATNSCEVHHPTIDAVED